jgi:hypothetical protein
MSSPGSPDSAVEILVNVVTPDTHFLGTITLPAMALGEAPYHFRLVELLNNPKLGLWLTGQQRESLPLRDVYVLPRNGARIPVAEELFVRPENVVCAYEYGSEDTVMAPVQYNRSLYRKPEQVVILTTNGLLVDGEFLGGIATLAGAQKKRFFPLLGASLAPTSDVATQLCVPFLVVNNDAVVAFSTASPQKAD